VKGAHLGANPGRAELLLCPDLTASERGDAGGNAGKNIAPLVLAEVWAGASAYVSLQRDKAAQPYQGGSVELHPREGGAIKLRAKPRVS
jgi:hypothetical protein